MAEANAKKVQSQILLRFGNFQPSSFAVAVQVPLRNKGRTADVRLAFLSYLPVTLQKQSAAPGRSGAGGVGKEKKKKNK